MLDCVLDVVEYCCCGCCWVVGVVGLCISSIVVVMWMLLSWVVDVVGLSCCWVVL